MCAKCQRPSELGAAGLATWQRGCPLSPFRLPTCVGWCWRWCWCLPPAPSGNRPHRNRGPGKLQFLGISRLAEPHQLRGVKSPDQWTARNHASNPFAMTTKRCILPSTSQSVAQPKRIVALYLNFRRSRRVQCQPPLNTIPSANITNTNKGFAFGAWRPASSSPRPKSRRL